jgi:hypothetical protein
MYSDFKINDRVRLKENISFKLGESIPVLYIKGGTIGVVKGIGNECMDKSGIQFEINESMSIYLWTPNDKIRILIKQDDIDKIKEKPKVKKKECKNSILDLEVKEK